MKTLYHKTELDGYIIKYYLTTKISDGLSYFGIMITSENSTCSHISQISDIFPYKVNAITLLSYLSVHNVTPLSMKDAVMEYMDEKFISC